ncbi:N-acetyl-D-glucosamine ABC transport system, permease protein 1 [Bacillus sp. JCM 19046]|uniref:Multiple sugar transport system permease protein n=1 Tax=Shouchella xiaoxiensis TaxID=766895 RepID=A0ABS2SZX5_9BACI|nr:sugar ABC transporter permease [Shouchella xiaoxiensis]MBM7841083.1 multiple sugar transport system permease protein [Shouchella xiaoxiensis]GAF14319.1 N-acetyl-D-glucosamine ABC transport system, permease protein 1 [Bacillus sp. JCM 19045]GAF17734.1 N-acetyl-D-glucosamine ABC transport system, permease protein 1 [Bacillus sp. JCM 19046]
MNSQPKQHVSTAMFLAPYLLLFFLFIVIPVIAAIVLSFTYFNAIEFPSFVGLANYVNVLTQDSVFMQYVLPNTVIFALIVGPGGYILAFILAWMLAQISKIPRTILALIIYSPSMTSGIAMAVVWSIIFSGDQSGYLNSLLMQWGLVFEPIQWLQSPQYLLAIMIVVTLWGSMGVGFLAMLSGVMNINKEIYEAGYIDGISNRFQEIIYITIPSMRPQMLFGAVMAIVQTFQAGAIGVALSGANPTPQYAGQLMVNHLEDFGFIRYEMGYAAAISVILLLFVYIFSIVARRLFADKD